MRILNSYIVDKGSKLNINKRTAYSYANRASLYNIEPKETFRTIRWVITYESKETAINMRSIYGNQNDIIIKFKIPPGCFNAGSINEIGNSYIPDRVETLISPYTVMMMRKKDENMITLNLAKDSKDFDFSMKLSNM